MLVLNLVLGLSVNTGTNPIFGVSGVLCKYGYTTQGPPDIAQTVHWVYEKIELELLELLHRFGRSAAF